MVEIRASLRHLIPVGLFVAAPALGQESVARFGVPVVANDSRERFEALADMNADGFMDALSVWWDGLLYDKCHLRVFLNDQTGKLVAGTQYMVLPMTPALPQAVAPWNVATGDLDGDGFPEVLVGVGSQVKVLRSLGGGSLQHSPSLDLSGIVKGVILSDYDGDGALDAAVDDGALTIFHIDPSTLAFTPFTQQLGILNASLFPVEMNGDGAPDLLVCDATNVSLYPVVGGQLQAPIVFAHQCADPKPQAGDIDGDGDEDIVLFDITTYTVLRRNGPTGSYTAEYGHLGGTARFLHDIDGDGDLDGVCCGGGGGPPPPLYNELPSSWRMSFNDGAGNFGVALQFEGLGSYRLAGAADLDHDGDLDLVAGRTVFYARGPWTVPAATQVVDPIASQLGDFDCDADVDLQLSTSGVRRNLADGRFSAFAPRIAPPPPGNSWSSKGYVGDFDGDGDDDMVVRKSAAGNTFVSMELLLNEGGGSFVDAGPATVSGTSMTTPDQDPDDKLSFTVDIDLDGDVDIVAGSFPFPSTARIWTNDGAGHFTLTQTMAGALPQIAADFNEDGFVDMTGLSGQGTSRNLVTWRGLGNGTFANAVSLAPSVSADSRFAVADLDDDGDMDITGGNTAGYLVVWSNNLQLGFTAMNGDQFMPFTVLPYAVGLASRISVADIDGDGLLDIVAGPADGPSGADWGAPNCSWVVRRMSNNTWYETPNLLVMRPTAMADVDGDGDVDGVGSHTWLNMSISGSSASACRQSESGTPDAFGMTPTLGGCGPFQVGHQVDLRVTGAPPQTNGFLFKVNGEFVPESPIMASVMGFGPSRLFKVTPIHTSGIAGFSGTGSWTLPFTVPPYLSNETRSYVAVFPDPAAPGHLVRSNEFTVRHVP